MSGPVTASYSLASEASLVSLGAAGGVWLAAQALREAQAMGREYAGVMADLARREAELEQARQSRQAARLEHQAARQRQAAQLAAHLDRLLALAASLAEQAPDLAGRITASPAAEPPAGDEAAWPRYLHDLEAEVRRLEAHLAGIGRELGRAAAGQLPETEAPALADVLHAYAVQRRLDARLAPALAAEFEATAARILARLDLAEGEPLPRELESLARTIVLAPDPARAEALAAELRLAVQRHQEARIAQAKDAAEARELLDALGEAAPEALRQALEQVAIGARMLDDRVRDLARRLVADLDTARQRREQEAAALVLEQSLRDLGYEVAAIADTLFVDGGVVHFQRHGWEGYYVRLRLDARERTLNFNVVRARGAAEGEERRRLDYLAEDRWCAEFPRLLETLKARGIQMNVTRQLGAGELPVQAVDPASLPNRQEREEDRRDRPRAQERPL
jgi:hypothetical protein